MKQKMKFSTKVKFIFWWLFKKTKGTMTIVTCGNCNSKRVTFKNGKQEGNIYTSEYTCKDCGTTAKCTEVWSSK